MKKICYIAICFVCWGCNLQGSPDCFQSTGEIIQQEFNVEPFKDIIVFERVKLFISEGRGYNVTVETGDNLINEVKVVVEDSILKLKDNNSCNFVRDYETTKVFVTAPNLERIRNSSGSTVENIGPLTFKRLSLISEDQFIEDEFHIDGDFDLDQLDVSTLTIDSNGISTFYLEGKVRSAIFGLSDGDGRIEAANLEILDLLIRHRSTNKMIVHPIRSISGQIISIGDVISKNRPPVVDVEELFTGRLIFE